MRLLLSLLLSVLLAVSALAQEPPAGESDTPAQAAETPEPPPCGTRTLSIAAMQWPSAQILAEIHARILTAEFDCDVQVVSSDLAAAGSGMAASGQPAIAPEMWISRIAEIWNQGTKAQQVRQAGTTYVETAFEGWFIPDYVAEAHPELTNAASLATQWKIFAGSNPKARFISCPIDWGCAVINRNLLKALGLDTFFNVVEPANRFELDTLIAEAVSRKEAVLFYYWQPNAVLSQFKFKELDLGSYDQAALTCLARRSCPAPKPSAFAPEPVVIGLADWVYPEAPEIAAYFQRAKMPIKEMNALLAALNEPGATVQTVADLFVSGREEIWRPWLGTPLPTSE